LESTVEPNDSEIFITVELEAECTREQAELETMDNFYFEYE
jgi:hypothetical protein